MSNLPILAAAVVVGLYTYATVRTVGLLHRPMVIKDAIKTDIRCLVTVYKTYKSHTGGICRGDVNVIVSHGKIDGAIGRYGTSVTLTDDEKLEILEYVYGVKDPIEGNFGDKQHG